MRLSPLMKEADERHREFRARWDEGAASLGWQAYKKTEIYEQTLERYYAAQKRLEEVSGPILESLREGRAEAIVPALAYLAVPHRPFRSGYLTQRLARALKKFRLGPEVKETLRKIILDRLTWPWSQPRDLWRLIPSLRTPTFYSSIRLLADHRDRYVQDRVRRVVGDFLKPEQ